VTLRRSQKTRKPHHYSIDQFYAGISPDELHECGHTAREHIVTFRRTAAVSIKCEANCECRTWYPPSSGKDAI
jgi:hypothetical protein